TVTPGGASAGTTGAAGTSGTVTGSALTSASVGPGCDTSVRGAPRPNVRSRHEQRRRALPLRGRAVVPARLAAGEHALERRARGAADRVPLVADVRATG